MFKKLTQYWEDLYAEKTLEKFLQEVKDYFEDEEIKYDTIRNFHRFSQIQDLLKKGIIDNKDYIQTRTEISNAAFYILEKIKESFLPILSVKAAAGIPDSPHYLVEYQEIEEWRYVQKNDIKNKIGIRVDGNSMEPDFYDGDILICKKTTIENILSHQTIIIVCNDGRIFLKKIKK